MQTDFKALDIESIRESTDCGTIHYFDSLDSTSSWLLKYGKCGDICISEEQTVGRGRRGNTWESPRGNIFFSMCWCFTEVTENWSLLGLVVGIAVADALAEMGLKGHGIKWPNDVFWNLKKLGGILLETADQSGKIVIGIGLNISLSTQVEDKIGQAATSINEVMGITDKNHHFSDVVIAKETIYTHLINHLQKHLANFKSLIFDEFVETWKIWDVLQGRQISFNYQNEKVTGEAIGIDKFGRLKVLKSTGEINVYSSAEIKLTKNGNSE